VGSAVYNLRVLIVNPVRTGEKRDNAEDVVTWPEESGKAYSAKRLSLTSGEEIRQGVKEGTNFLKLEIRGRSFPVESTSRIKIVSSGQWYRVTGPPNREERVTILSCESI
jgi:hypothetical protein